MEKICFDVRYHYERDGLIRLSGETFTNEDEAKKTAIKFISGNDSSSSVCGAEIVKVTTIEETICKYNRVVSIEEDKSEN